MRRRLLTPVLLAAMAAAMAVPAAAPAKKGGRTATETVTNVPIATPPNDNAPAQTEVKFQVGKKFKGKSVGKVELSLQVTGTQDDYIADLSFFAGATTLTAPNGRTAGVFTPFDFFGTDPNRTFGPTTYTPDSPNGTCFFTPCAAGSDAIGPPWAGQIGAPDYNRFYGVRMKGTWVLHIFDAVATKSGVLNKATLTVKAAKPIPGGSK